MAEKRLAQGIATVVTHQSPPKVSIACLIYRSTRWLDFVYDQVRRHTDLSDKEFYFVANDATDAVLAHLRQRGIPHHIHTNTPAQRQEWYINNVYRAWNTAGRRARGEHVVFINSDMGFTPGWLEMLQASIADDRVVCSRLVERGVLRSGLYGIERNFGNVPEDYRESEFLAFASEVAQPVLYAGGLYMPMLIKKSHLEQIGYYPEGNIVPGSDIFNPRYARQGEPVVPGDQVLIARLNSIGVAHTTCFGSIVYHFQEGEMRDTLG